MQKNKINVLVTGVGAIIGYGIIRNLQRSSYDVNIVGIDIFKDAVGQKWCDAFIQGLPAAHENYITFINNVIKEYNIDIVIPGIEQDLERLVADFKLLPDIPFVLNNKEYFNIFHSKLATYKFLDGAVPLIPTIECCDELYEKASTELGLPFIVKQDISYASKGFAVIHDKFDFDYYMYKYAGKCIAQKKMEIIDSEFTCSVFGLGDGFFVNPVCLKRELSPEGSTKKAENMPIDTILLDTLSIIAKKCLFIGPTNLQFIKYLGEYYLLEINARVSSATSIRQIFGVNEAEMCLDYFINRKIPDLKKQKFGKVIRYIEDHCFDSCDS